MTTATFLLRFPRRIANATGVHRHVDDLLLDPGCVTCVRVIQQKSAPLKCALCMRFLGSDSVASLGASCHVG